MSKYKDSLADVVAGDTVVYVVCGYAGTSKEAHEVIVNRVTKTRVMVNRPRDGREVAFSIESGREIGSSTIYKDMIEVGKSAERSLAIGRKNMLSEEIKHLIFLADRGMKEREPFLLGILSNLEHAVLLVRELKDGKIVGET